jgi:peptide/nickel transport system permease protein
MTFMQFKFVILWTDALIFLLVIAMVAYFLRVRRYEHLRAPWRQVAKRRLGMSALVILLCFVLIGLFDSVHFRRVLPNNHNTEKIFYSTQVESLLDVLTSPLGAETEKTYSAPFATQLYTKSVLEMPDGREARTYPRLLHGAAHLKDPKNRGLDILIRSLKAGLKALMAWLILTFAFLFFLARRSQIPFIQQTKTVLYYRSFVAWREILLIIGLVLLIVFISMELASKYHILGTDKVGKDVFYESIKSIRTGLIIGTLTTLVMLPFAVLFGTLAGYFGGWVDDAIQYIYTTLSSIPGVLLISAAILSLQVFITNHPNFFPTLEIRADARLLALCVILGIGSWTSLCRILRGETLKLREMEFIQAALALGVGQFKIIRRHILPNMMHIILITVVLDFSMLVLAEAVLSYVGVGVDPTTYSWGNMINSARLELAREPIVWWPLLAAFVMMFTLVLSANLFSDAVRDAFDPRLRHAE